VGIEHIDDIIADFEQSFKASTATSKSGETSEVKVTAGKDAEAPVAP
jgi:O-acetylhomoserine/O-acetylserine sulfhydrylase